ncbi:GOLPH3/VPS74 family protein [Streptomyces griseorubiginosus]|uniref:GOLPH3/VPS74 family protein n=1 Tax=Streptomyces griseorubiginosus TaxID=67304 RepID=UPI001AD77AA2|nr:GPP34 family phosphoprotein [Streptomyces griseorubiginosus]MBO4259042.1 GPP34 family phosphoprotein [Streptomyces griseorubiginosus]
MPHGSLSLPARLCLLAWDSMPEAMGTAHLVRAGALTELARRGLLTDEDGIATPADMDSLTSDAVLDGLLELVRESRPHRWPTWVTLHARVTSDAVREQLTADGCLRAERKRVLGVFPSVDHVLERTDVVESLREEARGLLERTSPVAEVSEEEAAAVALAVAAGLPAVLPDGDRERHKDRVEELIGRTGVSGILSELCSALATVPH